MSNPTIPNHAMTPNTASYQSLLKLVGSDKEDHRIKALTELLLQAMTDWPVNNQKDIIEFLEDVKQYFGSPLKVENISNKQFNGSNSWHIESGSSLISLIQLSKQYYGETNIDNIVRTIIDYYERNQKPSEMQN